MVCSRCGAYFCWICVKQIDGYNHFENNTQCNLWQDEDKIPDQIDLSNDERYERATLNSEGFESKVLSKVK